MRARFPAGALLVLAMLAAACDSPTIPPRTDAYDFSLIGSSPRLVFHWPLGSPVAVYVQESGSVARRGMLEAALDRGAAAWNDAVLHGEYRLDRASSPERADAILRWSDDEPPVILTSCPPAGGAAVTTFCLAQDPLRLEPFRLLDGGIAGPRVVITISASRSGDIVEVERLVAHELGHLLGIWNHSPDAEDLMWGGTLTTDRPTRRDRETMQLLYQTAPDVLP